MSESNEKRFHLRSRVKRDAAGNITSISVERTETPRFHTPAYDELVSGKGLPRFLWKKIE